jgi:hypothetical protein
MPPHASLAHVYSYFINYAHPQNLTFDQLHYIIQLLFHSTTPLQKCKLDFMID